MPPRFSIVFIGNILWVGYCFMVLKNVIPGYRFSLLIHSLRMPVEGVLYLLFIEGQVPEIMTFTGYNFDIFIGISAMISLVFGIKLRDRLFLIWNYLGLIFLLNIVIIAILSAPLPFQQFSFSQPNLAVLNFPFTWLPSFIVPVVFLTHILTIKHLKFRK